MTPVDGVAPRDLPLEHLVSSHPVSEQKLYAIRVAVASGLGELAPEQRDDGRSHFDLLVRPQAIAKQDFERRSLVDPESLFVGGVGASREQELGHLRSEEHTSELQSLRHLV